MTTPPKGSHSPGPWRWTAQGVYDANLEPVAIADGEYLFAPNADADGPLLAGAPDLLSMLRELEWSDSHTCPICHAIQHIDQHTPDCRLSALLRELP